MLQAVARRLEERRAAWESAPLRKGLMGKPKPKPEWEGLVWVDLGGGVGANVLKVREPAPSPAGCMLFPRSQEVRSESHEHKLSVFRDSVSERCVLEASLGIDLVNANAMCVRYYLSIYPYLRGQEAS